LEVFVLFSFCSIHTIFKEKLSNLCVTNGHLWSSTAPVSKLTVRSALTRWHVGDWETFREHIVLATVWGQNVKFSICQSIPSMPCCHWRTGFLIQVTVFGFSYLCATRRSQNFYRVAWQENCFCIFWLYADEEWGSV
jgi:hypothetical protein